MPQRRIPCAPAIVRMTPRYRMVVAHGPAVVAVLVDTHQHTHLCARRRAEVVPLVGAHPLLRQVASRSVRGVDDTYRRRLNRGMTAKIGTHQLSVPGPVVFGIGSGMNADKSTAAADEAL